MCFLLFNAPLRRQEPPAKMLQVGLDRPGLRREHQALPLAPSLDEAGVLEFLQVMADRRLAHREPRDDGLAANLACADTAISALAGMATNVFEDGEPLRVRQGLRHTLELEVAIIH